MAHDVTLLDLLLLLIALLVVLGLVVIVRVLVRLHRRRQAVRAMRARAQMDQWDAAGMDAVRRRPPTRLEDLLEQHEAAEETLRANLAAEADRHDDLDGLATEWWRINDRRDSR